MSATAETTKTLQKIAEREAAEKTAGEKPAETPAANGKQTAAEAKKAQAAEAAAAEAKKAETAKKKAEAAAAEKAKNEPPREQESVPVFGDEAKRMPSGGGYAAYAILPNGDLRLIGLIAGGTRQQMAGEARKQLAKMEGFDKEKAAKSEIISARPANLRRTPPLTA